MHLTNADNEVISHNVYWLSPDGDYKAINSLIEGDIQVNVFETEDPKKGKEWSVRLTNESDKLAFFTHLQLMAKDKEILPSYWSGNYVTLAPSEKITLTVTCPEAILSGKEPYIKISGWNIEDISLYP